MERVKKHLKAVILTILVLFAIITGIVVIPPILNPTILPTGGTSTIRPEGDGTYHNLYPQLATNWQKVDDTGEGDGDSTYVYTSSTDDEYYTDLYQTQDFELPVGNQVDNVTFYIRVKSLSSARKSTWYFVVKTSAEYEYLAGSPSTDYILYSKELLTNPNGSDWTESAINAMEIGEKGKSKEFISIYAGWCTQVYAVVTYSSIDTTPPTYSDIGYNSTIGNQPCEFSVKCEDDYGLGGYIFSTDNTDNWENDTWTSFSSNPEWAYATKILNNTQKLAVGYRWYFNDTFNQWNDTGIQTLIIDETPLRPCGDGTYHQFEPQLSTNWQRVNDTGEGDGSGSYVYTPESLDWVKDLYEVQNISMPENLKVILTIYIRVHGENTAYDAYFKTLLKTHGTEYEVPMGEQAWTGSSYNLFPHVLTNNPYTNEAWTVDEINNLEIGVCGLSGVKITLHPPDPPVYDWYSGNCTQVWVSVRAEDNMERLIDVLSGFVNAVNWTENIGTAYLGWIYGITNKTYLENQLASLTDWKDILRWSAILLKFGIENQTQIEWALDHAEMVNGLPKSHIHDSKSSFCVDAKYLLYGYYWADKWNHNQTTWNTTVAYNNFHDAWVNFGHGFMFYYSTTDQWQYYNEPRWYGESSQTLSCFLTFYELCNVEDALDDAIDEWNWYNNYGWYVGDGEGAAHFQYVANTTGTNAQGWEMCGGAFLQTCAWLFYHNSSLGNNSRLMTDINNRYLADLWESPQYTYEVGEEIMNYYMVVHHHTVTRQRRLDATCNAWASLFGMYNIFSDSSKEKVQHLLTGYDTYLPAWRYFVFPTADENLPLHCLYNCTSKWFRTAASVPVGGDWSNGSTASASALMFMLGIVPVNATLAVPLEDIGLLYQYNLFDPELFNISISDRKVTVALNTTGYLKFQFNNIVYQNFSQSGLYTLTFSSDWNEITQCERIGDLPSNRKYLSGVFRTELSVGWNDFVSWAVDVDHTLGEVNASLNLDSVNWTVIIIDYNNGTQWELVWDQAEDEYYGWTDKVVNSTSDIIAIYCLETGEWYHEYP